MIIVKLAIALIVLLVIFLIVKRLSRRAKRKRLSAMPFPPEWIRIVEKNVPLYNRIPETLKKQLHGFANIFLTEKMARNTVKIPIN